MARSQVDLANRALGYLARERIRDLDGDSPAAVHAKAAMDDAKEFVIEEYDWPQCRVVAPLVAVSGVALRGYTLAYAAPADLVKVWFVGDFINKKTVGYEMGMSSDIANDRSYIFTNEAAVNIRYGSNRVSVARFSPQTYNLIAIKLAQLICMPLTKDAKLHRYLGDLYKLEVSKVITSFANAEPEVWDVDFIPEAITERSA